MTIKKTIVESKKLLTEDAAESLPKNVVDNLKKIDSEFSAKDADKSKLKIYVEISNYIDKLKTKPKKKYEFLIDVYDRMGSGGRRRKIISAPTLAMAMTKAASYGSIFDLYDDAEETLQRLKQSDSKFAEEYEALEIRDMYHEWLQSLQKIAVENPEFMPLINNDKVDVKLNNIVADFKQIEKLKQYNNIAA